MDQLYLELKAALLATGTIKTVQVYRNQINRLTASKNGTGVIGFPAVLIEFSNIKYRDEQYTGLVRLHTVCYSLEDVGLKMFSTLRTVHGVAEGFYTAYTSGLERIADDSDNDFTNTAVNITDYQFRGWFSAPETQTVTIKQLDITGETRYIL